MKKPKPYIYINSGSDRISLQRAIATIVYGEIPKGYIIHHKDTDNLNNNMDNLIMMTYSDLNLVTERDTARHNITALRTQPEIDKRRMELEALEIKYKEFFLAVDNHSMAEDY